MTVVYVQVNKPLLGGDSVDQASGICIGSLVQLDDDRLVVVKELAVHNSTITVHGWLALSHDQFWHRRGADYELSDACTKLLEGLPTAQHIVLPDNAASCTIDWVSAVGIVVDLGFAGQGSLVLRSRHGTFTSSVSKRTNRATRAG